MPIVLSSDDVTRLARAVHLLVSPLEFACVDAWRRAVNREVGALLDADSAGFMMPVPSGLYMYSEEHDPAELAKFPGLLPPALRDGTPIWTRLLERGPATLADTYGADYDLYTSSAYYNEFAAPNGACDTISAAFALACPLPGQPTTGALPAAAGLQLWRAHPERSRFGEREVALLEILFPALRAGVETQIRFGRERARLFTVIDELGDAVRVADGSGAVVHQTPALCRLLCADVHAAVIDDAITSALRCAALALRSEADTAQLATMTRDVATPTAGYRITLAVQQAHACSGDCLLLARVARVTPQPVDEEELRLAHGLTRAESRVARLIALGRSNAEIAHELFISPHTARRHTERVLAKMGVRSRAEAVGRVLR